MTDPFGYRPKKPPSKDVFGYDGILGELLPGETIIPDKIDAEYEEPLDDGMRVYAPRMKESRLSEGVLPFYFRDDRYIAMPQRPFKPRGLALYNVPKACKVSCFVGTALQVGISYPPIPAEFFKGRPFEEMCRLLEQGIEVARWGSFDVASPGIQIIVELWHPVQSPNGNMSRLDFDPAIEVCMWGHCITHAFP